MAKDELYATKALLAKREQLGYTQAEMADVLSIKLDRGVSPSLYQKWESGRKPVDTNIAVLIARELQIRLNELWKKK